MFYETTDTRRFSIGLPRPLWIGLTTVVLVVAAVALEFLVPIWRQHAAIREIERLGGSIETEPAGPEWLREWYDDSEWLPPFDDVVSVDMGDEHITDAHLQPLRAFSRLTKLNLDTSQITDAGLASLAGLACLERLDLSDTQITEAGLAQLRGMNRLEYLDLSGFKLTRPGLTDLCKLPSLKVVTLRDHGEHENAEFVDVAESHGFDLYWLSNAPFEQMTKQSLRRRTKVVLVYCYASKDLKWDHEALDFDLAKHVAYQLNGRKIKVVDPDRVYAWLDKHTRWRKTSEIGAAFKVDYVVHIDVKDCSFTEANTINLYRGRADCIVNVVKMDDSKRDGTVIFTTPIRSIFPTNGPVDQRTMPFTEFKKRYLSFLSDEIGRLFYPVRLYPATTKEAIPSGVLGN